MIVHEMIHVMRRVKNISQKFCTKAVKAIVYLFNMVYLRPSTKHTSYVLRKDKKSNLSYLHVCSLRDREQLDKFDLRRHEGIFLGNSLTSITTEYLI